MCEKEVADLKRLVNQMMHWDGSEIVEFKYEHSVGRDLQTATLLFPNGDRLVMMVWNKNEKKGDV